MNVIQNSWKETDDAFHSGASTSAMDECHMKQVKSVFERTLGISFTAIATEVRTCPASVYHIITKSLGKQKVCTKWIPLVLNDDQQAIRVLFATTHLQCWRNEDGACLDHMLTVDKSLMHSFDPQLKQQNAEWCVQKSPGKKIAQRSQGALKFMLVMFSSRNGLMLDHTLPVIMTISGQYYCALLQNKVRLAVHCKQPELLERGVILLQDNATAYRHCDVQNLVQRWCWEVLAHPPYFPDLVPCDYWLFAHVD